MPSEVQTGQIAQHEVRRFKMHPKLLMDVIRRQAGTLEKALLEGVQNSIDAKATRVDVTIEAGRVILVDDGGGFPSRTEIEQFFEVFGQPHDESEGKIFGTFRMGRGQMFAFGHNQWRSGEFAMEVDIDALGLDYHLQTGLDLAAGCRIEIRLYEKLNPLQLHDLGRALGKLVKYVEVPVYINGEQVNKAASTQKWGLITNEAWMNINPGGESGIDVYNLGVHVCTLSSFMYGCSGVVVTRQQVRVNFARNDILSTCSVWRKVVAKVRELAGTATPKQAKMTAATRACAWRDILSRGRGDFSEHREAKLFVDSNGDALSLRQVESRSYRLKRTTKKAGGGKPALCFAARGSFLADKVMQHGFALVLDRAMLDISGLDEERFLASVRWGGGHRDYALSDLFELGELEVVGESIANATYSLVAHDDLTRYESEALKAAMFMCGKIGNLSHEQEKRWGNSTDASAGFGGYRELRVGESATADGWTDGRSYIAVRRSFISKLGKSEESFHELAMLLAHEWCHRSGSVGDHSHDLDFYRAYHDLTTALGSVIVEARGYFHGQIVRAGRQVEAQKLRQARKDMLSHSQTILEGGQVAG